MYFFIQFAYTSINCPYISSTLFLHKSYIKNIFLLLNDNIYFLNKKTKNNQNSFFFTTPKNNY